MFSIHPYRTLLLESEAKAKLVKELLEEQAHSIKVQNELAELVEANAKYRKAWDTLTESLNGYSATYLGNGKSAAKQVLEVMSELMKEKP
jgi:lipid A disaccharide synthetase